MSLMRSLLLAASESPWLRRRAPELPFIKKAVRRFMPGETLEDALDAAAAFAKTGDRHRAHGTGRERLGCGTSRSSHASLRGCVGEDRASGLDCHISVKLTQLGLDVDPERCCANVRTLAARAKEHDTTVWIDMEQHTYVDATLAIYRRVLS